MWLSSRQACMRDMREHPTLEHADDALMTPIGQGAPPSLPAPADVVVARLPERRSWMRWIAPAALCAVAAMAAATVLMADPTVSPSQNLIATRHPRHIAASRRSAPKPDDQLTRRRTAYRDLRARHRRARRRVRLSPPDWSHCTACDAPPDMTPDTAPETVPAPVPLHRPPPESHPKIVRPGDAQREFGFER